MFTVFFLKQVLTCKCKMCNFLFFVWNEHTSKPFERAFDILQCLIEIIGVSKYGDFYDNLEVLI